MEKYNLQHKLDGDFKEKNKAVEKRTVDNWTITKRGEEKAEQRSSSVSKEPHNQCSRSPRCICVLLGEETWRGIGRRNQG